eukprot:9473656-Pyramimonas_sp.AAC.1
MPKVIERPYDIHRSGSYSKLFEEQLANATIRGIASSSSSNLAEETATTPQGRKLAQSRLGSSRLGSGKTVGAQIQGSRWD